MASLKHISLAQVVDTMAEGVFVVDASHRIVLWNRAMEGLTGYTEAEVLGKGCSLLQCYGLRETEADQSSCPLLDRDGLASGRRECSLRGRSGEQIPVLKNACVLKDKNGATLGLVETVTDLRPVKYLEQRVEEIEQASVPVRRMGRLVGAGLRMQKVYERIRLAANSHTTILVLGETGTGKELAAEAIHFASPRKQGSLIKVNCSALSEGLLESELFGHVKGAFTGAIEDKVGRFEAAHGGTIFLDEIGDISPLIQLKLLRVLQERQIEPVGSSRTQAVDVRVIAATHRDLRGLVREGRFRQDLYYRLRVFQIDLPALRERKEDIPLLIESFMERFNRQTGKSIRTISSEAMRCLMDYCWPGNVRELENALEHAYVTCQASEIGLFDLPPELRKTELREAECPGRSHAGHPAVSPAEADLSTREQLIQTLENCGWKKAEAARRLGLNRATIWRKMKQWNIPLEPPASESHPAR
ncbi:MAG TPA: sigma 54-interacting transcriptional regulator [Sedimentisphaerales bacterium]|jgi:PAS domain S-box-containing protein|nr:sigma 54-interacting transcriptional regulator [Sedimentisphaerales bacterium]HNU31888.1 sigma 54-interacting transcriptional regulator [Sedimentisphaerales bacterium]